MKSFKLGSLVILSILFLVLSIVLVKADSTTASWARTYCKYNAGSGGYACDSGNVAGDSASCNTANGVQCAEEGDVYCYGESSCEVQGTTTSGPTNAYNVNWDSDSADCSCKMGAGRWGIRFVAGTNAQCCGDDASEFYIVSTNPKNIDAISTCCKADAYVYNAACCGDDANEYYAGPTTSKSCDGTKACCTSASQYAQSGSCVAACANVTTVYFTDMAGNVTPLTPAVDNKDHVKMVAEASGIADGTSITFSAWGIKSGAHCYEENSTTTLSGGKATIDSWQVKNCSGGETMDGIKFRAFVTTNPKQYNESSVLPIDQIEENTPPHAAILQPAVGSLYQVGQQITFISGSYDIDDSLSTYLWTFGATGTSNDANPNKTYDSGGPQIITLTMQDERGQTGSARTGILINSSANDPPLAFISTPELGESFSGLLVDFDASLSRDDIKTGIDHLLFKWEFDDHYTHQGMGIAGAKFTRLFTTSGEHQVKLTVDDFDPFTEAQTTFYINGCQVSTEGETEYIAPGTCSALSKHYYCEDAAVNLYYDTLKEHCEGFDGNPLTVDDCCPRGYYCPTGGAMPEGACAVRPSACEALSEEDCNSLGCIWIGICMDPANLSSCSDYPTQSSCINDSLALGVAGGRGLGTDVCGISVGNYTVPASSCKCSWDTVNGICRTYYDVNSTIGGAEFLQCAKNFSLTPCIGGKQVLAWDAICSDAGTGACGTPDGIEQCGTGRRDILCWVAVSRVNFFNFLNIISVILLILLFYYVRIAKLKNKGGQKSSLKKITSRKKTSRIHKRKKKK